MFYVNNLVARPRNLDNSLFGLMRDVLSESSLSGVNSTLLTNVEEFKDKYELKVFVPGVEKENIDLYLKDGVLTVSVKAEEVKNESSQEVESPKGNMVLKEVKTSVNMQRSFNFGESVSDEVIAVLDKGILLVTVQKTKPEDKTKRIDIL